MNKDIFRQFLDKLIQSFLYQILSGQCFIGRDIDIIKLNGSIELAPILGLSDVIVDIVETGTTLKENNLAVLEEFMPISARFIANKASYKFKYAQLTELLNKMKEALAK